MPKLKTRVRVLSDNAVLPIRHHEKDTGYDLTFTSIKSIVGDVIFFRTGISLQPPSGYYFDVVPRSSISKLPLAMANSVGVIDESYTGEILIPVRVLHKQDHFSSPTERYANGLVKIFETRPQSMVSVADLILSKKPCMFQAILRKRNNCDFVVDDLSETERGSGGFGSTDSIEG